MTRKLVLASALALGTAFALPGWAQQAPAVAAAEQNPGQILQSVSDQLASDIGSHKAELTQDHAKLVQIIDKVLRPRFDVDYAAILVLGRHAREATPPQRQRFADAFYRSLSRRYADGLLDYDRHRIKVLPYHDDGNARRAVAKAQITLNNGKTASVDFAFHKTPDGQWEAYDVIIEGLSYITNYRNQVDEQIRKEGLDKLIQQLEDNDPSALKVLGGSDDKQPGKS